MAPLRFAICARVSTDQQAERTRGLPTQLAEMRAYVARVGGAVVAEISDDISGTIPLADRPGGAELYRLIQRRAVDAVCFHTVGRVTRDEDLIEINVVRRDMRRAGLELHYADSGKADLSTLGGIIDTVKAGAAADERLKIIERSIRGRRAKAEAGLWIGQGAEPYGYRRVGHGRSSALEIDPAEADVVRRIFDMLLGMNGQAIHSVRRIVETLTAQHIPPPGASSKPGKRNRRGWHTRSVNMILRRRAYTGLLIYRDIVRPAPSLRIVEPDVFLAAQERLARNRARNTRNRLHHYLLAQHIRCTCGRAMIGRYKGPRAQRYFYYDCAGKSLPAHLRSCDERYVRADQVEGQLWDWIQGLITDESVLATAIEERARRDDELTAPRRDRVAVLQAELARMEHNIEVWVGQYADAGEIELRALKVRVSGAELRLAQLLQDISILESDLAASAVSAITRHQALATARHYRDRIANADFATKRFVLDALDATVRLVRTGDHLSADMSISLGDWAVTTNSLQISLPATPAQCCDTRPAPRTPACRPC